VGRLHALLVVRLDELAEVVGRDPYADPGLVHRDGMDPGLAEAPVVDLQPVCADTHQVVDELRPVVDVRREVDEPAHLGRHVPRPGDVVEPPGLVADPLDHSLEHAHVVELGRREVAQRRQLLLGLVALEQEVVAGGAEAVLRPVGVAKAGISSFLVTLATLLIVRGTALYISNGFPQPTLDVHSWLQTPLVGTFYVGNAQVHASLIWFIVLAILLGFVLKQTRVGNWIMATGGNPEAARARGIKTDRLTISLFVLCSALASLAGLISDLRVGSAYPDAGVGYELEVIAMCVIGGTSLFGGTGTILGTVLGVILLRSIRNGVILVGVPGLAYNIFVGGLILIAMLLQVGLRRLQTGFVRFVGPSR